MDLLVFNTTLKNVVKTLAQPLTCLCKSYNHFVMIINTLIFFVITF